MRQKQVQKRIGIFLLCLLLAVFWLATVHLAGIHTGHNCQQWEGCPVCLQIHTNTLLRQWLFCLCLFASLLMVGRTRAVTGTSASIAAALSLVSSKVKLSC